MTPFLDWADFLLNPFAWIAWLVRKGVDDLTKDYRDDPVYERNLQMLIERHRQFEDGRQ